jgi:hypothetical protein
VEAIRATTTRPLTAAKPTRACLTIGDSTVTLACTRSVMPMLTPWSSSS